MLFDEKSIEEHLLFATWLTHNIQSFVNSMVEWLHQEVATKVCDEEAILEILQSSKIEIIFSN